MARPASGEWKHAVDPHPGRLLVVLNRGANALEVLEDVREQVRMPLTQSAVDLGLEGLAVRWAQVAQLASDRGAVAQANAGSGLELLCAP